MSDISEQVALKAAISAAGAAGKSLMKDFVRNQSGSRLNTWMKSPGALVTEADLAADKAIAESLQQAGVDAALLSEESQSGDQSNTNTWLVDPLCGTVPFRAGMAHWGVNIALRQGAQLSAGVISLPQSGQLLTAATGHGAALNGEKLGRRDPELPISESVVGLEVDGGAEWARLTTPDSQDRISLSWPGSVSHTNTFASAAYPIAMVCLGGMSSVVFYKIDSVHLAAGALIAQELGAIVSDEQGKPLDWLSEQAYPVAVVAWPSVHSDLIEVMNS